MTEDNLICSCGNKKYEWQKECWKCKENKEVEEIWKYSKEKGEVTNEKYVICPYCGYHYGEDDLHESMELTCDECGKQFKVEVEYTISYSTYKKNENNNS